jgi:hypothetical protein
VVSASLQRLIKTRHGVRSTPSTFAYPSQSHFDNMILALVNAGFDADEVDEYFYFWQFCSLGIPGKSLFPEIWESLQPGPCGSSSLDLRMEC